MTLPAPCPGHRRSLGRLLHQVVARLPLDVRTAGVGVAAAAQLELFAEHLVAEVGVLGEVELYFVAGFDVLKLLYVEPLQVLQCVLLLLLDDRGELRMIDKCCQPELWYPGDD